MGEQIQRIVPGKRLFRLSFLAVLLPALVLVLAIAIRWAATLDTVQDFIATQIEQQMFSDQRITMGNLRGDLFKRITIEELTVADSKGDWLQVTDAEVAWNPWALLRGNLEIELVKAERFHVDRAPLIIPTPDEEKSKPSDSSVPNGILLEKLELPLVTLGSALSARSETYAVHGSATAIDNMIDASLDLHPVESQGDTARVIAKWSPETGLNGDVTASGQADGLLAKLLQLSPGKEPKLVATASNHADASRVELSLHVDSDEVIALSATRDTQRIHATGAVDMSHFGALSLAVERVGSVVEFNAHSEQPDRLNVDIKTPKVEGTLSLPFALAELKPDLNNIAVDFSTDHAPSVLGVDDIAIERVTVDGDLTRNDDTISFTGSAAATEIEMSAFSADHIGGPVTIRYSPERQNVDAILNISSQTFVPHQQQLVSFTDGSLDLNFEGSYNIATQRITSKEGVLSFGDQRVTFSGVVDPKGDDSSASGAYRLKPGSVHPDLEIAEISGEWSLTGGKSSGGKNTGLQARTFGTVSGINQSAQALQWHLELPIRYESEVVVDGEILELRTLSATSDRFTINATGSKNGDQLQAQLSAETDKVQHADYTLGDTTLTVDVNGTLSNANYSANIAVDQLKTANASFEDFNFDASGSLAQLLEDNRSHRASFLATMLSVSTDTTNVDQLAISGDVSGPLDSPRLKIVATTPRLASQSETIADVDFSFDGNVAAGDIKSNVSARANWRGEPVSVESGVTLSSTNWRVEGLDANWGGIFLDVSLSGQGGALDTVRGDINVRTESASSKLPLDVNGGIQIDGQSFTGEFTGGEFTRGDIALNATQLRFSGTPQQVDVTASSTGSLYVLGESQPAVFNIKSQIDTEKKQALSTLAMSVGGVDLQSVSPLKIQNDGDALAASGKFGFASGTVELLANRTSEKGELRFNWTDVSATDLAALLNRPALKGVSTGQLLVNSNDENFSDAEYSIELGVTQLATTNEKLKNLKFDATGSLRNVFEDSRSHRAKINARIVNANTPSVNLDGLNITADVSGPVTSPQLIVDATAPNLTLQGETISDIKFKFDGIVATDRIASSIDTRASWRGEPVSFSAGVALDDAKWKVDQLDVDWGGMVVDGSIAGEGVALDTLRGAIDVKTERGSSRVPVEINGGIRIDNETFSGNFVGGEFTRGAIAINATTLNFSGTPRQVDMTISSKGAIDVSGGSEPVDVNINSLISPEDRSARSTLEMTIADLEIKSLSPISMRRDKDLLAVSGNLGVSDGTVQFSATRSGDKGELSLSWKELSATGLARLLKRPALQGLSSGQFELRSDGGPVTGEGSARVRELSVEVTQKLPANIEVEANLDGPSFTTRLTGKGADVKVDTEISLAVRNPGGLGALRIDRTAPVTGKATGSGNVDTLWNVFGPEESKFTGQFNLNASLVGSIDAPDPRGTFRMSGADFEDGGTGFHGKDIAVTADFRDKTVRLNKLQLEGANGGSVSGKGTVSLDGSSAVTLRLDQISPFQRSDFVATLSGDLKINRSGTGLEVTGAIDVEQAKFDLDHLPAGGFPTLDVTFEENETAKKTSPPSTTKSSIDVDINSTNRILIVGKGIDSDWRTNLNVTGPIDAPELRGDVQLVRGTVELVGRRLTFAESSVRFDGDLEQGRLAIRAERPVDDLTAAVEITGTVGAPSIKFTSIPEQPEDEVLSRLLFGRSAAQLSGLEAAQLAIAISSLSGGKAFDFAGPLKRALGVERLNVGVSDEGSATVSAGKYLRDDVYVEARTSASGEPGVSVEWTPRENIEIGGKVESEKGPTLSLKWKRDYDPDRPEPKPESKP